MPSSGQVLYCRTVPVEPETVHSDLNRLPTAGRLWLLMSRPVFLSIAIVLSLLPVVALAAPAHNGRRHAGTATASCRAINSPRITPFQLTPRELRFRAWRAATSAPGISIRPQVITGTTATGTISAGLAFTAVATMAAASALAGRGRRLGRSGIAADQAIAERPHARASVFRQRRLMALLGSGAVSDLSS